jgi:GNAT superfamily N-acetyltransferase
LRGKILSDILTSLTEESGTRALLDNWHEFIRYTSQAPNFDMHESDELFYFCLESKDTPVIGMCIKANLHPEDLDEQIEKVISYYKARSVQPMWLVSPDTTPPDLGKHLETHGLQSHQGNPGMASEIHELKGYNSKPEGLEIRLVEDEETMRVFWDVWAEGYNQPSEIGDAWHECVLHLGLPRDGPDRYYLGYWEGAPVATGYTVVGGGVVGLFGVVSLEEARGRGIGTAMTMEPLLEAQEMGYKVAVLWATRMGLSLYRRLGFKEIFTPDFYMGPGGTTAFLQKGH